MTRLRHVDFTRPKVLSLSMDSEIRLLRLRMGHFLWWGQALLSAGVIGLVAVFAAHRLAVFVVLLLGNVAYLLLFRRTQRKFSQGDMEGAATLYLVGSFLIHYPLAILCPWNWLAYMLLCMNTVVIVAPHLTAPRLKKAVIQTFFSSIAVALWGNVGMAPVIAPPPQPHRDALVAVSVVPAVAVLLMVYWYDVNRIREALAAHRASSEENKMLLHEMSEAVKMRDRFLAIASHELRTPLTPLVLQMHSATRLLKHEPCDRAKIIDKMQVINDQLKRLVELTENLLDISRISSGHLNLNLEWVDLVEVTHGVLKRFSAAARKAHSALTFDANSAVLGQWDPVRLDQAITNILTNALKYGGGHPIHVKVFANAGWAHVSVEDHGIGISARDKERIFRRFERAVSERHFGGLGLGLWIVQAVVAAQGGTINVASEPGRYTIFTISLPVQTAACAKVS